MWLGNVVQSYGYPGRIEELHPLNESLLLYQQRRHGPSSSMIPLDGGIMGSAEIYGDLKFEKTINPRCVKKNLDVRAP